MHAYFSLSYINHNHSRDLLLTVDIGSTHHRIQLLYLLFANQKATVEFEVSLQILTSVFNMIFLNVSNSYFLNIFIRVFISYNKVLIQFVTFISQNLQLYGIRYAIFVTHLLATTCASLSLTKKKKLCISLSLLCGCYCRCYFARKTTRKKP